MDLEPSESRAAEVDPEPHRGGFDRRAFLVRAAAGAAIAGAAWAAPNINSVASAQVFGSPCAATTQLDWSTPAACSSPGSLTVGGVLVSITTSGTGLVPSDNFEVRHSAGDACGTSPGGNSDFPRGLPSLSNPAFSAQADDDFYSLHKDASGGAVSATFTFTVGGNPRALRNIAFAIGDIDRNNNPGGGSVYTDLVTITAVDAAGNAMLAPTVAANINISTGGNAPTGSNPFTGTGTLITDNSATVVIAFKVPIRAFTVTFANSAGSPAGPQWIAISDIIWCTI